MGSSLHFTEGSALLAINLWTSAVIKYEAISSNKLEAS